MRTIATRLADQRRRLDWLRTGDLAVRACFEVSFSSLPGPAAAHGVDPAHAFRLLGLWQGPSIGLPAAAALIGQPEDAVADALEVLVDAQLLQAPAPDRYRFHDLLRAYAAERAAAEEAEQDCDDGHGAAVRLVPAQRGRDGQDRVPEPGPGPAGTAGRHVQAADLRGPG